MIYVDSTDGSLYGPDRRGNDREATTEEIAAANSNSAVGQRKTLLIAAQAYRETLISRLTWLKGEAKDALTAAQGQANAPEIALQTANIAAINAAIDSLVTAFEDPRVVAAVNGAVKQAVQIVYAEIVQAFKVAAPAVHARFKKLDAL